MKKVTAFIGTQTKKATCQAVQEFERRALRPARLLAPDPPP
jgi:hypothetical protein